MRVGMHSTEFGDISIRTTLSQQQMLAQISLDHSDLGPTLLFATLLFVLAEAALARFVSVRRS